MTWGERFMIAAAAACDVAVLALLFARHLSTCQRAHPTAPSSDCWLGF